MTLKQIAEKYHCDQRTVRTCILLNKSSGDLGKQNAPTKLQPYIYTEYPSRETIPT
jgi:hypothetical protein